MQKRNLKYALLGLLNQQSLSGYDMSLKFEEALSEFWAAKHSQIYPELKKLVEEGKVTYDVEIAGTSLEKKIYSITEDGREDFMNWLHTIEPMQSTPKDVFRLRVFFSAYMEPEARLNMLRIHLEEHRARLAHLQDNSKRYVEVSDKQSPEFSDKLVLIGAIMREEMTCKWLEQCIEMCSE